jgi:hypothetical protein
LGVAATELVLVALSLEAAFFFLSLPALVPMWIDFAFN